MPEETMETTQTTEGSDISVMEDPIAEEAYVYLQRERELTPAQFAALSSITPQEASTGLALLRDAGFASSEDGDTFRIVEETADGVSIPNVSATTELTAPGVLPAPAPAPAVENAGLSRLDSRVIVAIAKGEHVKLRITGWVELHDGGVFHAVNIEQVHDARMPGEGPVA